RPRAKKQQQQQQQDEPITVNSSSSSSSSEDSEDDYNTIEEDRDTAFSSSTAPSVNREMPARKGRSTRKARYGD
ncbi:uncharacterized protein K452DRAFT_303818, partial [Aplosporella prunicola CBS 121167]